MCECEAVSDDCSEEFSEEVHAEAAVYCGRDVTANPDCRPECTSRTAASLAKDRWGGRGDPRENPHRADRDPEIENQIRDLRSHASELRDRAERVGAEVYREVFDGNFGTAGEKVIDANRLDFQAAQIEAQANRMANGGR